MDKMIHIINFSQDKSFHQLEKEIIDNDNKSSEDPSNGSQFMSVQRQVMSQPLPSLEVNKLFH